MAEASVSIYEDVNPLVWSPAAWVMEGYLRSWQMDFPDGSNDLVERFLELVYSKIHDKLAKELLELIKSDIVSILRQTTALNG